MSCWFWHNWKISNSFEGSIKGSGRYGNGPYIPFKENGFFKIMSCKDCNDEKAFFVYDFGDEMEVSIFKAKKLMRDKEALLNETI